MNRLPRYQLPTIFRQFRNAGTPREWIKVAIGGILFALAFAALYILL